MAKLLQMLRREAEARGLLDEGAALDAAAVFLLVRDMPYRRATDRQPQTTLREWRGTCSGKHYLLQALFAELGIPARLIACTVTITPDPAALVPALQEALRPANGRFVDVHNYLILDLPGGEMAVDATWPLSTKQYGLPVNETFVLGQSQPVAYPCRETFVVPPDVDPQAFKQELLQAHFSDTELSAREAFIQLIGQLLDAAP